MARTCYPSTADWSCYPGMASLTPSVKARSEALAWSTLAALTGWSIGLCPITVRPCAMGCARGGTYFLDTGGFAPYILDGQWLNSCGCTRIESCACTSVREIVLPGPVGDIAAVTIDGAALDFTAYRIDNGDRLVRQDGADWPTCQDMNLPDGEVGTFSITYTQGAPIDGLLNYAAGLLAAEFAEACLGNDCKLPSGVTQITRQGVSLTIATGLFENGQTGIREVDAVIRIHNPHGLKSPARIISPDGGKPRLKTWGRTV